MWNISSPARAEKRQGQCPAAAEIYRFLDRLPCFPADYVSFLPVQLQSHQHQLLPAAPGEEPSGVAPVLPEPSRFIQPDRRCVLRNNLQLQLRKARLLRTLDARKRQRPADAFARLLQAAAIAVSPAARQSAVAQILYHVGRWIYLADAWDDLAEDREAGNYNPLLARYGDQAEQHQAALRETMHVSLGLANTAYALLDWGVWEPLLGHILTIGLPAVEEAVFTGQWKQAKHPRLFQRDQAPALPAGETDKENKKL